MNYNHLVFGMFGGREKYEESIEKLVAFAKIPKGEKTLELCCGTGIATKYLLQRTDEITAVELNPRRIEEAKEHLPDKVIVLNKNASDLSLKEDGNFPFIICVNGYHYFDDTFYEIIERMLAPKGRAVFNVKLKDFNGTVPIHKRMGEIVKEAAQACNIWRSGGRLKDTGYIESSYTEETFKVPEPFRITKKEITPLFFTADSFAKYKEYWLSTFFNHVKITRPPSSATLDPQWEGYRRTVLYPEGAAVEDAFYRRANAIPANKRLAKVELLVEIKKEEIGSKK